MKTFDLYSVDAEDLDHARSIVEPVLETRFVEHESGFHCGRYFRHGLPGAEHFVLQRNYDDFAGEWTESDFRDSTFLLYVNETARAEELKASFLKLAELTHRRRDEL